MVQDRYLKMIVIHREGVNHKVTKVTKTTIPVAKEVEGVLVGILGVMAVVEVMAVAEATAEAKATAETKGTVETKAMVETKTMVETKATAETKAQVETKATEETQMGETKVIIILTMGIDVKIVKK